MTAKQETMDDKKEKTNETETDNEENPQVKVEIEGQSDTTTASPSQQSNEPTRPSSGQINAVQPPLTLERHDIMYVRVSQPTGFESLCTRILEDCPDDEDILPPVVDFSIEHMLPGWYQALCASPDCHGDL